MGEVRKMDDKVKKIALELVELSKEPIDKSDITTDEIEMSLIILGKAQKLLRLVENHCFK